MYKIRVSKNLEVSINYFGVSQQFKCQCTFYSDVHSKKGVIMTVFLSDTPGLLDVSCIIRFHLYTLGITIFKAKRSVYEAVRQPLSVSFVHRWLIRIVKKTAHIINGG